MDVEMVIVRIVHIGFGAFWLGSAVFLAFVLEPTLRSMGPDYQGPVMGRIGKLAGPVIGGSGVITILAGIYLALRLRFFDRFPETGWGWAILIGFVVALAAMGTGGATGAAVQRMGRIREGIEDRPPNPDEASQLQRLAARLTLLGRATAILVGHRCGHHGLGPVRVAVPSFLASPQPSTRPTLLGRTAPMTGNLRIGLIGCGGHGLGRLSPALTKVEGVELAACADPDEVAAYRGVEQYGYGRPYLDHHDMLSREELDAVVVATPHHLLKDAAIASIQSGRPVFVEKPMATSLAEGEEVRDAADRAGVPVTVGYCQRFAEGRRTMKSLLERGAVGEVAGVCAGKGSAPLQGWLADPKKGGGQLLYLGVHVTDQVLWMVDSEAERVYAEVSWHPDTGADQNSAFTIRFKNGVIADVLCSQNVAGSMDFIEVIGSAGRVRAEWASNVVYVYSEALVEYRHPTTIRPNTDLSAQMYEDELKAWVASLVQGTDPPVTVDDGLRVLEIIDAVFTSGRTGEPVTLA